MEASLNGCKHCEYVGGPGLPPHDPTFPCPGCGRGGPVMLYNSPQDPEQSDVRFYPVTTAYSEGAQLLGMSGLPPKRFYENILSTYRAFGAPMPSDQYTSAVIEGTWYSYFQPEYKAYPAIIAALAATKIEIGCEHLRMPFPVFSIRLPTAFVKEGDGPPIRSLMACIGRDTRDGLTLVTHMDSVGSQTRTIPMLRQHRLGKCTLLVRVNYNDINDASAFSDFEVELERGVTLQEAFDANDLSLRQRGKSSWTPSPKLIREMLALVVGVSFFATGRQKATTTEIIGQEKRARHERRRFQKDNDGEDQPAFTVGRDLVLPREEGAPTPDSDGKPGEGSGRSLKRAHYRTGHLRYQAHGPALSERKLIFVEPLIVRPDLPLGPRVTPGALTDRRSHDVTD